jgi:hypothetical protein
MTKTSKEKGKEKERTQHNTTQHNTTQKAKKTSKTNPTNISAMNPSEQFLLVIRYTPND